MLDDLKVELFADGAEVEKILAFADDPRIKGFTTNPSLMWKAGLTEYESFARTLLERITDKPVSLEVFADDEREIIRQALVIQSWGSNVYVKIPVTTTKGESLAGVAAALARDGVHVNVTAVMTLKQVKDLVASGIASGTNGFVSIFAGRIADAGVDPAPLMARASGLVWSCGWKLIWASPREVLNVAQADEVGCHIITLTEELIGKLSLLGKDLEAYSLETVRMFHDAAKEAGYKI